ncbi:Creatinase/aminopeptidase [Auricularia subglabra TFB-10046 SS5]|uniref:Creatinase/aminopeptidase n=1 Tax=Auricularia subglabra (strain TFB-10046 / SS5) TaxID=717982 RepID=J0D0T1_AURST|nr:Creatinase/aminopeptidase [Auricularia subglabra TFB-10046 SS5]
MPPPPPPPPMCFPFLGGGRSSDRSLRSSSTSYSETETLNSSRSGGSPRVPADRLTFTSSALLSRPATVLVERKPSKSSKESPPLSRTNSGRLFKKPWQRAQPETASTLVSPNSDKKWSIKEEDEDEDLVHTVPGLLNIDSQTRLVHLREEMVKQKIDYYVVPTTDDHGSEYVALCDRRRQWISGFTGSAGTVVVSLTEAHLFVDSRYWTQAEREAGQYWSIHRVGEHIDIVDWDKWILEVPRGSKVGMDSRMLTHEYAVSLSQKMNQKGIVLAFPYRNLVDVIWKDRPVRPRDPIFILGTAFTGVEATAKIADFRDWMGTRGADVAGSMVASLSSIAWLLNLRGSDVPYNPVFLSYLYVSRSTTPKRSVLFTGLSKLTQEVHEHLDRLGVDVREYNDVWTWLRRREWGDGKVLITPQTPYAISCMLTSVRYAVAPSWIDEAKALKNDTEIAGFEQAYLRDGVAFVRWLAWMDEKMQAGFEIDEYEAGRRLNMFRKELEYYMGLAYENISATGPNAALPHYVPSKVAASIIDRQTPYLMDSGGQWLDGTCDTTRTVHYGYPTEEQREAFTRVLQGHIAIDSAVFPEGTSGQQLDVLARRMLWRDGLNYHHGTGHGFGSFLTVHEGPQSFSSTEVLRPGHVLTNEPGYYKEGEFGIRIESAMVVERVAPPKAADGTSWLAFRRLTCVPIQAKMVKRSMLSKEEADWLRLHNALCLKRLAPLVAHDKRAAKWLKKECQREIPADGKGPIKVDWH